MIEGDGAETRVVYIRRNGGGFAGWAQNTRHVTRDAGLCFYLIRDTTGQGGSSAVQLRHQIFHVIVGLRHAGAVEGVGFNDVGTGHKVLTVNPGNDVRLSQYQQVIIAFNILSDVSKATASVVFFFELVTLNQSAHAAIQNVNTLLQIDFQAGNTLLANGGQ